MITEKDVKTRTESIINAGLKANALSTACGISDVYMSFWRQGKRDLKPHELSKIDKITRQLEFIVEILSGNNN